MQRQANFVSLVTREDKFKCAVSFCVPARTVCKVCRTHLFS